MGMIFHAVFTHNIMSMMSTPILSAASLVTGQVLISSPGMLRSRAITIYPVINAKSPDPSIMQDSDGKCFVFGTNSGGHNVQVAKATSAASPWAMLDLDLLPVVGS